MTKNAYGHFSDDGREFVVTNPRTPRPWSNLIANPRLGLAVSQSGSGFTWVDNSQLAVVNAWQQDFAQDTSGKFLYVRDAGSGALWSLAPAPVWAPMERYACRHGLGYSTFETAANGVASEWTLFAHPTDTVELWLVRLTNESDQPRRLELTAYLEWNCGPAPAPRREFHKLFIETAFDPDARAVFGWNHMWDVPSARWGHWNTDFPYVSALATTEAVRSAEGEKAAFLGRNGSPRRPEGVESATWPGRFGRHWDPVAALRSDIALAPGERKQIGFAIAVAPSRRDTERLLERSLDIGSMKAALAGAKRAWVDLLAAHRMETGDASFDALANDWLRYQAISARIWGRAGYYQQSGAYGFRDQLQDSQVWLTIDPARCREQIRLHAAHQFTDGSVYHWWHPLSEMGHVTTMTDDLLWLAFVTANYLKETGDASVLDERARFLDDETPAPLEEHVRRAFERVFQRTSPRGIPYIGAGDWNDGLSAVGLEERGESVWLGHFLAGLLADWSEIHRRTGKAGFASEYDARRRRLADALNHHGWDGEWYWRALRDDGEKIGSRENRVGRIYLNAQTWAILNDVVPADRAAGVWDAVKTHLVREMGALLLSPAYDESVEQIGYITRYAPGLRENGGVYTHAATWAIAAAAKMKDAETLEKLLVAMDPSNKDPERYWAEPYVLPGNVDGPESPIAGRAGWTWYTGSAAWLHRVVAEWVLGVRPEWDGLRIDPCLPSSWTRAKMTRPWRGATYEITIERRGEGYAITMNGERVEAGALVPAEIATRS
ncbi:MAG: GH36-type glycosyl hydrolase domain-containing protein [Thermoanaerobaculia bacterium]